MKSLDNYQKKYKNRKKEDLQSLQNDSFFLNWKQYERHSSKKINTENDSKVSLRKSVCLQENLLQTSESPQYTLSKMSLKKLTQKHQKGKSSTQNTQYSILNMKKTLESVTFSENNHAVLLHSLERKIEQQSENIEFLCNQIQQLSKKLDQKEKLVKDLAFYIQQRMKNSQKDPFNENLNKKIDTVEKKIEKIFGGKLKSMKEKVFKHFHQTQKWSSRMNETIQVYLEKIKENVISLKESLPKTIETEELKETGTFGREEKLLSSGSYFFHTSQLQNHNKIHELFTLHQNTPIRVCIDADNRLKYKDSHAYIYDRRGNIVQLSSVEKKYYLDCGLITE